MSKTKIYSAVAGLALAGVVGSANAFTITAGDYKINFDNYDSGTVYGSALGTVCGSNAGTAADVAACDTAASPKAPGSVGSSNTSADTMGIISVSSITNIGTGATMFSRGADGYLTGVFGNLVDFKVVNVDPGTGSTLTTALSKGGTFSIYFNTSDYDPTCGPTACGDLNSLTYNPSISGGSLYLSGNFVTGAAVAGNAVASYLSSFNASTISGSGIGFLDFTGGTALATFDSNSMATNNAGVFADAKLTSTFSPNAATAANGWTVFSTSDVTGRALPEPASLALLGLGGLAAGWASRRRNAA